MNLAVFASGTGSNLISLHEKSNLYKSYQVACVVSDKPVCGALSFAKDKSIPAYPSFGKGTELSDDIRKLLEFLYKHNCNLIVLAGFLKLIPLELLKSFQGTVINIHPALLPFFGGRGMYGMNVHKAVFESGMKVSGATVHLVNEEYDRGAIVSQKTCDISHAVNPAQIAESVLKIEHTLLPEAVDAFARGRVKIINNRVYINYE